MSRLEAAVVAIAQFLAPRRVPYMVIGGVANALIGVPRATLDVDLTVWVADEQLEEFVRQVTQAFPARTANPVACIRELRVLPLETADGIRVDMIFGQLPYEEEAIRRAEIHTIHGVDVPVCSAEDLILYKLVSEREKDRNDVRGIIRQQCGHLDRRYLDPKVAELARGLDRPDIQTWYAQCFKEAERRS